MGVALAVVASHVGAAAPVALADATSVQRVRGEEHSVTANALQEAEMPLGRRGAAAARMRGACVCYSSQGNRTSLHCFTTSHFPDTQTPRTSASLQEVPSRAGTMSCRWPSTVVQCRSQGLLEMCT